LRRAIDAGCDDYVPKPFYRKQLIALVERLIDNSLKSEVSQASGEQQQRSNQF